MACIISTAILRNVRTKGGFLSLLQVNCSSAKQLEFTRGTSFFNRSNVDDIWDSMTSVSNTGKKRGRASRGRLMKRFNIYKSQRYNPIGAAERIRQRLKEETVDEQEEKVILTKDIQKFGMTKLHPLDKGYTGKSIVGRRVGVPKNIDGYDFEENGFRSICIQMKYVARMTATQKNVVRASALVVLGNGNGLAGYAIGKAKMPITAIQIAKHKAALRLTYFEPFNDRTLWHNFCEQYHNTKLFAFRKHEGYGLVCHRVLKSICQVIGIKDTYIKVEGETKNYLAITSAFFNALAKQKTHQEMADEFGYNIVEYNPSMDNFPKVIASPSTESKPATTMKKDLGFDYESYFMGGLYHKREPAPSYHRQKQYKERQLREYRKRNQSDAKMMRAVLDLENPPPRY